MRELLQAGAMRVRHGIAFSVALPFVELVQPQGLSPSGSLHPPIVNAFRVRANKRHQDPVFWTSKPNARPPVQKLEQRRRQLHSMPLSVVVTQVVHRAVIAISKGNAVAVSDRMERKLVVPDCVVRFVGIGKAFRHPLLPGLLSFHHFPNAQVQPTPNGAASVSWTVSP